MRNNETGTSARGTTDEDGRYQLGVETKGDGVPPGEYGVAVSENRGSWDSPKPPTIDPRYDRAGSSGLSITVEPKGAVTYDIVLDAPGGKK